MHIKVGQRWRIQKASMLFEGVIEEFDDTVVRFRDTHIGYSIVILQGRGVGIIATLLEDSDGQEYVEKDVPLDPLGFLQIPGGIKVLEK